MGIKAQRTGVEESAAVKSAVQAFYNEIGWQLIQDGMYQNATYEDLRPVSRDYIHSCHLRILRHLKSHGKYMLDAGSGPIQYAEYVEYSRNYLRRVCVDISEIALKEARKRIGKHGLFVVGDIANLPFKAGIFDGVVSLHTIHHLPDEEHVRAYRELYRMLSPGSSAIIVDGWHNPPLMNILSPLIRFRFWLSKIRHGQRESIGKITRNNHSDNQKMAKPRGTFVRKYNAAWLKREVGFWMPVRVLCWRSVSVQFLRAFIHPRFGGRLILRALYWLEERFPRILGEIGQYPLIILQQVDAS